MRRHHNNSGLRQIARGKTRDQVARMAARMGIPVAGDTDEFRHAYAPTVDGPMVTLYDAHEKPFRRQIGYRGSR